MKTATIKHIAAHVAIEFAHGFEIVPTVINGKAIRYATIDADGLIFGWSTLTPPTFDSDGWHLDTNDLQQAGIVGEDDGTTYAHSAGSLRRITVDGLLAQ
jgi:hypothetical protein